MLRSTETKHQKHPVFNIFYCMLHITFEITTACISFQW